MDGRARHGGRGGDGGGAGAGGRQAWEAEEADRDVEVLRWVGRFRFVTGELVAERFRVSWQRANARLRRLERFGLVDRDGSRVGRARVVWLTRAGAEVIGERGRRSPRVDVQRERELAVVWQAAVMEREWTRSRMLSERECLAAERAGQNYSVDLSPWRRGRGDRTRWPDLVFEQDGQRLAIEVEFSPKGTSRLEGIVHAYAISACTTRSAESSLARARPPAGPACDRRAHRAREPHAGADHALPRRRRAHHRHRRAAAPDVALAGLEGAGQGTEGGRAGWRFRPIRVLEAVVSRALLGMEHLTLMPDDRLVVDGQLREPLMTAAQVAVLLAVPRSSVYDYARRQHQPLPSVRVGRHRRFLRSEVLAWLVELPRS